MTTGAGLYINPTEQDQLVQNRLIAQLIEGRSNAVGSFTLSSNATSTSVIAVNCAPTSVVLPFATTSTAANDFGLMSIVPGNGSFVVSHASNSRTTRTFLYAIVG